MLWKPVVYQSADRSIERNTLMTVYDLKNNITLDQSIDQGIFKALYNKTYVSAFNVSLGRANDGLFMCFLCTCIYLFCLQKAFS